MTYTDSVFEVPKSQPEAKPNPFLLYITGWGKPSGSRQAAVEQTAVGQPAGATCSPFFPSHLALRLGTHSPVGWGHLPCHNWHAPADK